jgi:hypothetical protein
MDKKKNKKSKGDKAQASATGIHNSNQLYARDKDNNSVSGNYNYVIDAQYRELKSLSSDNSQVIGNSLTAA